MADPVGAQTWQREAVDVGAVRREVKSPQAGVYVLEIQESRVDVRARLRTPAGTERWCDAPGIYLGRLFLVFRVAKGESVSFEVAANQSPSRGAIVSWRLRPLDGESSKARMLVDRMYRACLAYGGAATAQATTPQLPAQGGASGTPPVPAALARIALADVLATTVDTRDSGLLAEAMLHDAGAAYDLGEMESVAAGATRAAAIFRGSGDVQREAASQLQAAFGLTEMAASHSDRSSSLYDDADDRYTQAAEIFDRGGDAWAAAVARNARGLNRYYTGRYDDAYRDYSTAADALTSLGASRDLSDTVNNLALLDIDLGRYASAAERLERSRALLDETRDAGPLSFRMDNLGLSQLMLGRYDDALRSYLAGAKFHEKVGDRRELGRSLLGLGRVYFAVGNRETSRLFLENALELRTDRTEPRGLPATLRALAMLALADGDYPRALALLKTAERKVPNGATAEFVQLQRAEALDRIGARGLARASVAQLIRSAREAPAVALAHRLQGSFFERDGRHADARRSYAESRGRLQKLDLPTELADVETALGRLAARDANWPTAHAHFESAWNAAARTRQRVSNPELRAAVAAPSLLVADAQVAALRAQSATAAPSGVQPFAARSLAAAERARARVFEETLDAAGTASDARARDRAMLLDEYMTLQATWQSQVDRSGADDPRARFVATQLANVRARIDALSSSIAVARRDGGSNAVASRRSTHPPEARPAPGTAVVAYWLPRDGGAGYAWTVSASRVTFHVLRSGRELEALARRALASAGDPGAAPGAVQQALNGLGAAILDPLAAELVGKKRIVFVPDGALHYVPFAALPFGPERRPLVMAADVALAPAVRFAVTRPDTAPKRGSMRVLAIADPVYDSTDVLGCLPQDPRCTFGV